MVSRGKERERDVLAILTMRKQTALTVRLTFAKNIKVMTAFINKRKILLSESKQSVSLKTKNIFKTQSTLVTPDGYDKIVINRQ